MRRVVIAAVAATLFTMTTACNGRQTHSGLASGYVEATNVRIASKIAGRVAEVNAVEGARVEAGAVLATLTTTDLDFAIQRAKAERDQATATVGLLVAGSRPEDIQQAEALTAAAVSERQAVERELAAARADEARFEQLLRNRAGSTKQRDDAVTRRELAEAKLKAADDRIAAARTVTERLKSGARPQEVSGARARVNAITAQIEALESDRAQAVIKAPVAAIVSSRLVEPGELVAAGTPIVVFVDLDHAYASVFVQEPDIPRVKIDQAATIITDAGDRLEGKVSFISPKAEFTPRNVQTPDERAKLVYKVKVSVDNRNGVLKPGMPVEVDLGLEPGSGMAGDSIVELADAKKSFGKTVAVNGLSFAVGRGEMFGVIGPDGAGKTTSLRLICGLLKPDAGTIRVKGQDPFVNRQMAAGTMGYVSQRFSLYGDLSIDENIEFFARIHGVKDFAARRTRLLQLTGLEAFRTRLAERLSGGMKQKLALACVLVHEPPVLVLDEPTTGVDPVSRREFWKLLAEFLSQGLTIVMATPYLDEAERCGRVALIASGRVLALDEPGRLQAAATGKLIEIVADHPRRALEIARAQVGPEHVQLFGDRLHVRVTTEADAEPVRQALTQAGITIGGWRPIVPTLEDVFIDRLASADAPAAETHATEERV